MCVVLAMVIVICFHSGVTGTFIFDDLDAIVHNDTIQHTNLWQILKTKQDIPPAARPLTNLSYAIDFRLYGLNPAPYLWHNIVLQIVIAWCLYATLRLMLPLLIKPATILLKSSDWMAMALTMLWAIHPVQTECVLYITQRSEQYAMLGMVLTFYGLLRHHQAGERAKGWLVFSSLSCIMSMFFKQNCTVMPVILVLFDRAVLSGSFKESFTKRWRYFMWTAIGTWIITAYVLIFDPNPACTGTGYGVSRWEYLMTQSQVILHYLRNIFWPTQLCLYHDWPIVRSFGDVVPEFFTVGSLFVLGLFFLWKWPRIGLAITSIYLMLGPTSSVLPLVTEVAADRRMSLMMVFVIFPIAVLVYRLFARIFNSPKIAATITITVIMFANLLLMTQQTIWLSVAYGNPVILWTHTANQSPRPQSAWDQLGHVYETQGNLAPAWQCYADCLAIEPGYNIARLNMAVIEMQLGRLDHAIELLNIETTNKWHSDKAWYYLGLIYQTQKNLPQAINAFETAVQKSPNNPDYAISLAGLYNDTNQTEKALKILVFFEKMPAKPARYFQVLGASLSKLDRLEETTTAYQRYLQMVPDDARVFNSMGVIQARRGKLSDAVAYFARAVSIDPTLEEARDNLARARGMQASPTGERVKP